MNTTNKQPKKAIGKPELPGRVIGARHTPNQNDAPEYYTEQASRIRYKVGTFRFESKEDAENCVEEFASEGVRREIEKEVVGKPELPDMDEHDPLLAAYNDGDGDQTAQAEQTTGLPWTVETRPDSKYPDIILAQVIAAQGYVDDIGNVSRCAVTDWLDSPADAKLIVASVNNAGKLAEALRLIAADNSTLTLREFRDLSVSKAVAALAAWEAGQ